MGVVGCSQLGFGFVDCGDCLFVGFVVSFWMVVLGWLLLLWFLCYMFWLLQLVCCV